MRLEMLFPLLVVLLLSEFTSGLRHLGNLNVHPKSQLYSVSSPGALSKSTFDAKPNARCAILFDCDGVIVETEELHRLAYNKAFESFGLKLSDGKNVEWDTHYYDRLQNTVGMIVHFYYHCFYFYC